MTIKKILQADKTLVCFLKEGFLRWLGRSLTPYLPPKKPGKPSVTLVKEEGENMKYTVQPSISGEADIVKREFKEVVNAGPEFVFEVALGDFVYYAKGASVSLSQRDIDDDGNIGPWGPSFDFVATDTLVPPASGAPGLTAVSEDEPPAGWHEQPVPGAAKPAAPPPPPVKSK